MIAKNDTDSNQSVTAPFTLKLAANPIRAHKSLKAKVSRRGKLLSVMIAISAPSLSVVSYASAQPAPESKSSDAPPLSFAEAMDVLYRWLGPWTVIERHFDGTGKVAAEVKGTEEGRWILDERATRRVYRTATGSGVFEAEGTFSYNEAEHRFEGFWVNNLTTQGPSACRATWNPDTETMIYEVDPLGDGGSRERFRVVERFVSDKRRESTTYRVRGDQLTKVLEISYERSGPCPERQSTVRIIHGMGD